MTISADARLRPTLRRVLAHPAAFIALCGGIGLVPVAPGTLGTLAAFPLYAYLAPRLGAYPFLAAMATMFALGVLACHRTGQLLHDPDAGAMVWDEFTAFLLVLFFTPPLPLWQAFAFLLFRLFDVAKPPPIRRIDKTLRNGLGVMLDDLIAAFYALLVLAVVKTLFS